MFFWKPIYLIGCSFWVYDTNIFFRTRKVLEMLQPKDATETLLSNDGDSVLEGLTTNFFVVLPSVRKFGLYTNSYCSYLFYFLCMCVHYYLLLGETLSELMLSILSEGKHCYQKKGHSLWEDVGEYNIADSSSGRSSTRGHPKAHFRVIHKDQDFVTCVFNRFST